MRGYRALLQWLLNRSSGDTSEDAVNHIVRLQLAVIFVAIHTTTMTVTHMYVLLAHFSYTNSQYNRLYSLAVTPEYVAPLRDESREVLAANDNTLTSQALQQMVKVDSYMKEVFRLYPPSASTYHSYAS